MFRQFSSRVVPHSNSYPIQALVVGHELTRVAILWHELWHEGLEEASRLYFTDRNAMGMIHCLKPLHDMLDAVSISIEFFDFFSC